MLHVCGLHAACMPHACCSNKMDELSEALEDKERIQHENDKLTKQYLELLKTATADSPQKGKYAPDFE